jgi:hypothetical protein
MAVKAEELTYKLFKPSKEKRCEEKSLVFDSIALSEPRNHQLYTFGMVFECFSTI